MPCYDSIPTERDERAVEVAKLLVYVNHSLNLPNSTGLKEIASYSYFAGDHLDKITQRLCNILNKLKINDPNKFEALVYNAKVKESRDLANWWEQHEKFDKERQ